MELDYIKEKINIINYGSQEMKVYKEKLLDITYLYRKYRDNKLINRIINLKDDILEYKIYIK